MTEESTLFKDKINASMVMLFADKISAVYGDFDADGFVTFVMARLESLELKQRSALVAEGLRKYLPDDYPTALQIILQILDWSEGERAQTYGFHIMPISYFVECYGLDHYDESMHANYEITKRWSSEFAIRPYITQYPERTWALLHEWVHDEDAHIRRLVSEGTRPRLPWGGQLKQFIADPEPLFGLLAHLKDDPSEYVRRSVANNLNDISKDHPDRLVDVLTEWAQDASEGTQWIINHALRSLVKQGHSGALDLLGFGPPQITLAEFDLTPNEIQMGDTFEMTFTLNSNADKSQNLVIDYIVHFVKANGETRPKVFKLTKRQLSAHESVTISKRHSIKPITTRTYYAGTHTVELQINGVTMGSADFELVLDE